MITAINQTKPIVLRKASRKRREVTTDPEMVERLAGYGLNEKEIADVFGITEHQFYKAMRKYSVIKQAVERGKNKTAMCVVESLFKKATGFARDEIIYTKHKGVAAAHPVKKFYPPDMKAIIFWLKNRLPMEWKEKIDIEKGQYTIGEKEMEVLRRVTYEAMARNF